MALCKTEKEIEYMREAGRIVALAHKAVQKEMKPGISTKYLNKIVENVIISHGASPSFKGLYGFPAAACISVNSVLVHGIPDDTILKDGDVVSVDIGACIHGYHGDSAWTYGVGAISEEVQELMDVTRQSLFEGLKQAKAGNRLTDISHAIGEYVFSHGFSVARDFSGHGIGTSVHEDPSVPNFGPSGKGVLLKEGMTFAVEPMVLMGKAHVKTLHDGWSVVAKDGRPTAHFEHTIVITRDGYEILTTLTDKEDCQKNG